MLSLSISSFFIHCLCSALLSSPLRHWCGLYGDVLFIPWERNGPSVRLTGLGRHGAKCECVCVFCVCEHVIVYELHNSDEKITSGFFHLKQSVCMRTNTLFKTSFPFHRSLNPYLFHILHSLSLGLHYSFGGMGRGVGGSHLSITSGHVAPLAVRCQNTLCTDYITLKLKLSMSTALQAGLLEDK